jgi:hypothetical protein
MTPYKLAVPIAIGPYNAYRPHERAPRHEYGRLRVQNCGLCMRILGFSLAACAQVCILNTVRSLETLITGPPFTRESKQACSVPSRVCGPPSCKSERFFMPAISILIASEHLQPFRCTTFGEEEVVRFGPPRPCPGLARDHSNLPYDVPLTSLAPTRGPLAQTRV